MQNRLQQNFSRESATDMALQQVSLSGVIICPDQELEQRFAVNSFTVHLFLSYNYKAMEWLKDPFRW